MLLTSCTVGACVRCRVGSGLVLATSQHDATLKPRVNTASGYSRTGAGFRLLLRRTVVHSDRVVSASLVVPPSAAVEVGMRTGGSWNWDLDAAERAGGGLCAMIGTKKRGSLCVCLGRVAGVGPASPNTQVLCGCVWPGTGSGAHAVLWLVVWMLQRCKPRLGLRTGSRCGVSQSRPHPLRLPSWRRCTCGTPHCSTWW